MPLIRLYSHPEKNTLLVDKLIYIEGLPDEILFTKRNGKKHLKDGVELDVMRNYPEDILKKFNDVHEVEVIHESTEKGMSPVVDNIPCSAFRIDYMSGHGERVWKDIEHLIEVETPRTDRITKPATVGDRLNWKLSAEDVPVVRLQPRVASSPKNIEPVINPAIKPGDPIPELECIVCHKKFMTARKLLGHKVGAHGKITVTEGTAA